MINRLNWEFIGSFILWLLLWVCLVSVSAHAQETPQVQHIGDIPHVVTLTWDMDMGATSYNVYRDFKLIATDIQTTSYEDTTVESGAIYQYNCKAVDQYGNESLFSNPAAVKIPYP